MGYLPVSLDQGEPTGSKATLAYCHCLWLPTRTTLLKAPPILTKGYREISLTTRNLLPSAYHSQFWEVLCKILGMKKPTMFLFSAIMQGLPCHTLPGLSDLQNWRGRLFEPFAFITQKPSPCGQHCQVRLTFLVGNSLNLIYRSFCLLFDIYEH